MILAAVTPRVSALTMHVIVFPLPNVLPAIRPEIFTLPVDHVVRPLTVIGGLVSPKIVPFAVLDATQVLKKYFDIVYERNMNGGIAYQILWNNIEHFINYEDPESKKWLNYLLERDTYYSKEKLVPVMFWYGVGTSKNK